MHEWGKFVHFVRLQLETGDYDAHIPFLIGLTEDRTPDEACWLGLLYMAYYNEASAHVAFERGEPYYYRDLPIEQQRRNLYGGRIKRHLEELWEVRPHYDWLGSIDDWQDLLAMLSDIYGNGRWASYTTAELMTHLGQLDIQPSSYEILESSGPRQGLQYLGLEPSEENCQHVMDALYSEGITLQSSQLESILCDWAGCNKGTFYPSRNIDRQQGRILKVETKLKQILSPLWEARRQVFPERCLGEKNGWIGIDKKRLKVYKETGIVLAPWENR